MRHDEKEKNRALTPAEAARKQRFDALREDMLAQGYRETDLTVGLVYANIMAFVMAAPIVAVLAVIYGLCRAEPAVPSGILNGEYAFLYLALILVLLFVLIVAHELIHGITWSLFTSRHWKSISFGFIAQYMTPYCSCDEPLKKGHYLAGSLMPTIVLGVIPALVAALIGSRLLFVIAAVMILSGGGDLTISWGLLRFRPDGTHAVYVDHPYRAGLVAFVK